MTTQPEIQFYHLLATPLDKALPKLMERAFSAGMRTLIFVNETSLATLDKVLWEHDAKAFLPHGSVGSDHAERQPIYITSKPENPNNASLLVIVNGATLTEATGNTEHIFTRVFDIFDGADDAQVAAARLRWKMYADGGYGLRYVQQTLSGSWEIKKTQNL